MVKLSIREKSNDEMDGNEDDSQFDDETDKPGKQTVADSFNGFRISKDHIPAEKYARNQLPHATIYHPEKRRKNDKRPSSIVDPDNAYDMTGSPVGVMVIFNISKFEHSTGLHDYPRMGSDVDANAIKEVFLTLGFVVCLYNDVSRNDILEAVAEIRIRYSTLSCFACTILSHGLEGHFYAKDNLVKYSDLFSILESPYWVGKPKLFFLQACLGSKHMDSLVPDGLDQVDASAKKAGDPLVPLPRHSDFFYAYSTVPGYSSWRNTHHGSWFIQELCNAFRIYSKKLDLSRIMTRVNAALTLRVTETEKDETNNKRQVVSTVSQLRKDLYFFYGDFAKSKKKVSSVESFL